MARLNYTDSGNRTKKKAPPPQPFFRLPNTAPIIPKTAFDTSAAFSSAALPKSAIPKPPAQNTPKEPRIKTPSYYPAKLPSFTAPSSPLPSNILPVLKPISSLADGNTFDTSIEQLDESNPFRKLYSPRKKPPKNKAMKQALGLDLDLFNPPGFVSKNQSVNNPYINNPAYEEKKSDHQLYSFSPKDYSELPKDSKPSPLDTYNLKQATEQSYARNAKKTVESIAYGAEKLIAGAIASPLESVADIVAVPTYDAFSFLASAGGLAKNKFSDFLEATAQNVATDDWSGKYNKSIDNRYKDFTTQERQVMALNRIGGEALTMLTPGVIAKAVAGANKLTQSTKLVNGINTYLNNAFMSVNSGGKAMEQAASEGASVSQAINHGLTMGGFESITQTLAGGLPFMPKGKLTEFLKASTNIPIVKTLIDTVGEGGEGALRTFFEQISKKLIYNPNQSLASANELWQSFLQDFVGSIAMKAVAGQLDLRTKSTDSNASVPVKPKQVDDYVKQGKQEVSPADDMPDAKTIFDKAYSNSIAQFDKIAFSLDRAGNKLYNELGDSNADLFSQKTRSDLALAAIEATQSAAFKNQLSFIESSLGDDAEPFINGVCEDLLNDLAADLQNGGKPTPQSLESKLLSCFEDAEKIVRETVDVNNLKPRNNTTSTALVETDINVAPFEKQKPLLWANWDEYEKVVFNGHTYAKVGETLYSHHAVSRMQPSGKRYTTGDAIRQFDNLYGRSISPNFVEYVLNNGIVGYQKTTGNITHTLGSVQIVTNKQNCIVTVLTFIEGG